MTSVVRLLVNFEIEIVKLFLASDDGPGTSVRTAELVKVVLEMVFTLIIALFFNVLVNL